MKCRCWASFLLTMLSFCSFAQNVAVKISLKNERNESVQNATVQVLRAPDSTLLQVKLLKGSEVNFSLKKSSSYYLRITAVGINDIFTTLQTRNNDTLISLRSELRSKDLAGVTVTARKPLVTQEDDKTIIDAEQLVSSSTNAFEVLEKTPGALIDQDGNVYLNSATPAIIYINGREMRLGASDLASMLKSLPAGSIQKIEILRSPSAKYDASGGGGIVNIVLKKGVKLGLHGSVDVSHFQGVYPTNSIGLNLNNSGNRLNSYLSANLTRRTNYEALTSERPVGYSLFTQNSYTRYPNMNRYIGGGLSYEINKKWTIGYDGRLSANRNRSFATNDIDIYNLPSGTIAGKNISYINNNGPTTYFGNNFSAKLKIDTTGSQWENSLDLNFFRANNNQEYSNVFLLPLKNTRFGNGDVRNRRNITAFKSDLLLKFNKSFTFEAGTKLNFSTNRNDAAYFADSGTGKFVDTFQSNNFRYKENIAAAYLQVSKTFAGFTIKPGLRMEYTDLQGHQLFPKDTTFAIRRTDLFPYLYLRHKIARLFGFDLTGNLIARRSISRPSYEQLNPYPRFIDPYTFEIGNPGLQPQFINNYEFNVTADEFPVLSVGLNRIKNIFNSLTYQKGTTLFRTFDNLGKNNEVYMRLVAGVPPGRKYFFYAGTQLNAVNYSGFYNNQPFAYKQSSWTFFMYHNYKPVPTLNLSVHGFMRTNSVINFFELKTFGGVTLSANKSILKKKMNIIAAVNDLFRTNRNVFTINVPGFTGSGMRYGDTRRLGLTLKYNFGTKPKEEKKDDFEAPVETN